MTYCKNCGARNEDSAKFCIACGYPLKSPDDKEAASSKGQQELSEEFSYVPNNTSAPGSSEVPQEQVNQKNPFEKKKMYLFLGVGAAAAIAIILLAVSMHHARHTILLNKYVVTEANGYNGYAYASVYIDWDAIDAKYGDSLSYKTKSKTAGEIAAGLYSPMDYLRQCVTIDYDPEENLSNGDTVTYTIEADDDIADYVNCTLQEGSGSFTVSGLQDVSTFDAFSGVEVSFDGTAPYGTCSLNVSENSLLSEDEYYLSSTEGLSNGDTVTVSLNESDPTYYLNNYGSIPEEFSKDYEVSGLTELLMGIEDLSEEELGSLKTEAEDKIHAVAASENESYSIENLTYIGNAFGFPSHDAVYGASNILYLIYQGTAKSPEEGGHDVTAFYPVKFTELQKAGDVLSYNQNAVEVSGYSEFSQESGWYSSGYSNPYSCYQEIISEQSDDYTFTCGDGFEEYAEYKPVNTIADIPQETIDALTTDGEDRINSYMAENLDGFSLSDLGLKGEYLLTSKTPAADYSKAQALILVFSGTVSSEETEPVTVYFPLPFSNLIKLSDGTVTMNDFYGIQGNSKIAYDRVGVQPIDGYQDGTEMFRDLVTANRDNYNYEVSDGLKEFGE